MRAPRFVRDAAERQPHVLDHSCRSSSSSAAATDDQRKRVTRPVAHLAVARPGGQTIGSGGSSDGRDERARFKQPCRYQRCIAGKAMKFRQTGCPSLP